MVNNILASLLEGLFPQHCCLCGCRSRQSLPLCAACRAELPHNTHSCQRCALPLPQATHDNPRSCGACQRNEPPFDRTIAPWLYHDSLAHIIQRWKYRREHRLTPLLASLWLAGVSQPPSVDFVLPVPLHWRKLWRRGFNQAELLCRQLGTLHRASAHPAAAPALLPYRAMLRTRNTAAQAGMSAEQRQRNLRGAFTMRHPCDNLRIAIVDDVMTTGATAAAVATTLRNAGASYIEVWCLARTPQPTQ